MVIMSNIIILAYIILLKYFDYDTKAFSHIIFIVIGIASITTAGSLMKDIYKNGFESFEIYFATIIFTLFMIGIFFIIIKKFD